MMPSGLCTINPVCLLVNTSLVDRFRCGGCILRCRSSLLEGMGGNLPGGLVTLLFTDVVGSGRLVQELGASFGSILTEYRRRLRQTLLPVGGVEALVAGDSCLFAFADAG